MDHKSHLPQFSVCDCNEDGLPAFGVIRTLRTRSSILYVCVVYVVCYRQTHTQTNSNNPRKNGKTTQGICHQQQHRAYFATPSIRKADRENNAKIHIAVAYSERRFFSRERSKKVHSKSSYMKQIKQKNKRVREAKSMEYDSQRFYI